MKKSTWIIGGATTLALAALLGWALAPRALEVEVASVTEGLRDLDRGRRQDPPARPLRGLAPLAALLPRITLREGDAVEAGALLATLTPVLPAMLDERTRREQQLRVEIAQAQTQRVAARVEGAKVALAQARNEQQRTEQLAKQGFVAPTKLETDRLSVLAAQKDLEAAVEEGHIASHEVEQARAALLALTRPGGGRGFALRAPVAGRVLKVVQASEGVVALGAPILELGDTARLEVVAELLTADALRAQPGSLVRIERWGGDGVLQGRVRRVEPGAFTKVSAQGVEEQRVRVLIDLSSPPEQWRALGDGFRVGVRIVTRSLDKVLKVPVSAVFPVPEGEGGMAVFVLDGGRAKRVAVKLGARNGSEAWIESGVQPGAQVIVYPPAATRDGLRVKPRKV
jgi:HlyD family secretion protein